MDNPEGQKKWFHAVGACGKATANITKMFKEMGWFVTGTDTQFVPPASTILQDAGIAFELGYHYSHLTKEFWETKLGKALNIPDKPDLGLIVETATSHNKELLYAKKHNIDIRPFAQILKDYLVKPESIVVTGTAGKTTTTAIITFLLRELGLNPSYMIGADVIDFKDSLQNTNSIYSVLEGDEYYSKELSPGAKFLQFKPKYGIITKISWEHVDVYPAEEEYVNEFKKFVEIIPSDGLLIAKSGDKNIDQVIMNAKCKVVRYGVDVKLLSLNQSLDYAIGYGSAKEEYVIFKGGNEIIKGTTSLLGSYNLENILAAFIVFTEVLKNSDLNKFVEITSRFKGPRKRLEHLLKTDSLIVIDDFGVAPERAANSLRTLKTYYPDYRITAVFEPNSGSRPTNPEIFKNIYKDSFKDAYNVLVPTLSDSPGLITTEDFVKNLKELGFNVGHIPNDNLQAELMNYTDDSKTLIIFFSAYRLTQIAHDFVSEASNLPWNQQKQSY